MTAPAIDAAADTPAAIEPADDSVVPIDGQRDTAKGQVSAHEGRKVTVRIPYNVRDSYGTSWAPGVFSESLRSGRPVPVVLNHDDGRIVGKVAGHRETSDALELDVLLADPEAVPDARMVKSLLDDEMIDGVSFRFRNGQAERDPKNKNTARIRSAHLAHLSFVVDASIPGAMVVGRRDGAVDAAGIADLVKTNVLTAEEGRRMLVAAGAPITETRAAEDEGDDTLTDAEAELAITATRTAPEEVLRCARAVDGCLVQAHALLAEADLSALPEGVRAALEHVTAAGVAAEVLRDELGLAAPDLDGARAAVETDDEDQRDAVQAVELETAEAEARAAEALLRLSDRR